MQGWKTSSILDAETEAQHVHERKAFMEFFSQENIAAIVDCLIEQVDKRCSQMIDAAAQDSGGSVTVDMALVATEIVDAIVQNVRAPLLLLYSNSSPSSSSSLSTSSSAHIANATFRTRVSGHDGCSRAHRPACSMSACTCNSGFLPDKCASGHGRIPGPI